jgi:hypothetical protein
MIPRPPAYIDRRGLLPMPTDPTDTERAVVVQLLDRARPFPSADLHAAIRDGPTPTDIDAAVVSLLDAGVVHRDRRGSLRTTPAVQRLDRLRLIAI